MKVFGGYENHEREIFWMLKYIETEYDRDVDKVIDKIPHWALISEFLPCIYSIPR